MKISYMNFFKIDTYVFQESCYFTQFCKITLIAEPGSLISSVIYKYTVLHIYECSQVIQILERSISKKISLYS